jgi:hypothetical protein
MEKNMVKSKPRSNPVKVDKIVGHVVRNFSCFGGGKKSVWGNPLTEILSAKPPSFALGVDVEQVVRFVLKEAKKQTRVK